ncbi:MAG: molecular chaperone DnaJ [Myxococcota bacterium]
MSKKRDYYEILGVRREATSVEIKRAYRKLANKYHPDRNPGDKTAEDKFKEASEAYSVLSDSEKRASYDRFGHEVPGGGFGGFNDINDIFSNLGDIFGDIFGGGFRRTPRGQDIETVTRISFEESLFGITKSIKVDRMINCDNCDGSGAKPGTTKETCRKCNGQGQVVHRQGFFAFASTCPDCGGDGQYIKEKCKKCNGLGKVKKTSSLKVKIPAGVEHGQIIKISGKGQAAPPGGIPGDLRINILVEQSADFERHGYDLHTVKKITFPQLALGSELELEIPASNKQGDTKSIRINIPSGTQLKKVFTVEKKGVPYLERDQRGDLHVHLELTVPKKLNTEEKHLLEQYASIRGEKLKKKKSFIEKVFT